ncbi:MAG TPA: hypothetical protein VFP35_02600 [Candidatus Saccharimonadales bacterium]|nr:hypothetical protein [Candidatus Saccharimonadales bacterium]
MLDFLLILGRVPGTGFYLTFDELMLVFLAIALYQEEKIRHRQIVRWLKWARRRAGVNYRRYRRITRTFIKLRRYRLAVWERRQKRHIRMAIKRAYRGTVIAACLALRRFKRRTLFRIRRARRAVIFAVYILPRRKYRRAKMLIRRSVRRRQENILRARRRANRKLNRLNKRLGVSLGGLRAGVFAGFRSGSGH